MKECKLNQARPIASEREAPDRDRVRDNAEHVGDAADGVHVALRAEILQLHSHKGTPNLWPSQDTCWAWGKRQM